MNIRINDEQGKIVLREVKATMLQEAGLPEGFKFFIHKSLGEDDKSFYKWTVSEFSTGMKMHWGKTRKDAISNFLEMPVISDPEKLQTLKDVIGDNIKKYGIANQD